MLFILSKKLVSLRYLNLSPYLFGPAEKWLDKKAQVNFKINNVINWDTDNRNTKYCQYLKK